MTHSSTPPNVRNAYDLVYKLAQEFTSGSEVCENFLFAWYNVKAWGGWAPHSIVFLDQQHASAILTLLAFIQHHTWYPDSEDMDHLATLKSRKPMS